MTVALELARNINTIRYEGLPEQAEDMSEVLRNMGSFSIGRD
jgi:hypothetical protein